eukprot:gene6560-9399_t
MDLLLFVVLAATAAAALVVWAQLQRQQPALDMPMLSGKEKVATKKPESFKWDAEVQEKGADGKVIKRKTRETDM